MRSYFPLLIAVTALTLAGCGGTTQVTLNRLAGSERAYTGQHVLTRGVVRHERDPDGSTYFVLAGPRGALVGLAPAERASPFEGRFVQVSGLFELQPGFGRLIHITTIVPVKGHGD